MKRLLFLIRNSSFLFLIAVLLVVGCHHDSKQQQDTIPEPTEPTVTVTDTVASQGEDTTAFETQSKWHSVHIDTAEITNLRLFRKKQKVIYSPTLLVGEWVLGTLHMEYRADGSGLHWDTGEDIRKEEAQRFNWSLDSNLLTLTFHAALGGVVPKLYLVTFVDDENLSYRNAYDDSYLWDKVPSTDSAVSVGEK